MKRQYTAAAQDRRCQAVVTLRDNTTADCMRAATTGHYCTQHAQMYEFFQPDRCPLGETSFTPEGRDAFRRCTKLANHVGECHYGNWSLR